LRDVRNDHLLFDESGACTGLVDFGAVGVDSPVADLSRWLGDSTPSSNWNLAFDEYRYRLPLPSEASVLATALHGLGTVVSALRWYEWLALGRRSFARPEAAYARWRAVVARLETLVHGSK
jgi:aminoglycoside phosphotransferase (APT) family kinase protein